MHLHLHLTVPTRVAPSAHVLRVAAMFGLGVDERRDLLLIPPTDLDLFPGQVVFITGPSGSGKSTLLRLIAGALADDPAAPVIDFDHLPYSRTILVRDHQAPESSREPSLVDSFPGRSLESVTGLLSLAGLGDAFVMLRRPSELSDGQRYRWRLAQAMAAAEGAASTRGRPAILPVLLADEFGATLDRLTAMVIARNVRRWTSRRGGARACFIAATTHDDLLEPLDPDVLIEKDLGPRLTVLRRGAEGNCGSRIADRGMKNAD